MYCSYVKCILAGYFQGFKGPIDRRIPMESRMLVTQAYKDKGRGIATFVGTLPSAAGLDYSTVTDFARFRGWSTFSPRFTAM